MNREGSTAMAEGNATSHNATAEAEEERLRRRLMSKKESRRQGSSSQERPPKRNHRHDDRRRGGPRRAQRGPPAGPYRRGPPLPPPPPHHFRGPPPPYARGPPMRGPPPPERFRRSYSPRSYDSRSSDDDSRLSRSSRSRSRSISHSSRSSYSRSRSRSYSSHSSDEDSDASSVSSRGSQREDDPLTKDQRTIFVSQLVMRADERDVRRYFRRQVGCKVNDVIMLRDKRTGRHKGICYVELGRLEDVAKAVAVNNEPPDFQRFPILVKPSEAEKNYVVSASSATVTASQMGVKDAAPVVLPNGKIQTSQKVYLGNLDPRVSQQQLFDLFSTFGHLDKVDLQMEPTTGISKGFAFLSYSDPKEANLALQTMAGQLLAGKPIKTGWANQAAALPNMEVVISTEFPQDAPARIQKANLVLTQLTGTGLTGVPVVTAAVTPVGGEQITSTAEAAINAALGLPVDAAASVTPQVTTAAVSAPAVAPATIDDPKAIVNADAPTKQLLVRNMFDKDEETEEGWAEDIRLDFEEECAKYGKITSVVVMSNEPGGKLYASFETVDGAKSCASDLAGRWFDKRQLRVAFVQESDLPKKD
jgi:RNA-binding protein 39